MIQPSLDEVGTHEGRFVVERDEDAVDALRVVDDAPDGRRVIGRLRESDHDRLGSEKAAGLCAQVSRGAMTDGVDLVVVDAVHLIDGLGDLVDAGERRDGEDVSVLRLDHQLDVVRATEGARILVVNLDERVRLRQQVTEAGLELQLEGPVGEDCRDGEHEEHDRIAVVDQALAEPVEGSFVLFVRVTSAHAVLPAQPWTGSQLLPPSSV